MSNLIPMDEAARILGMTVEQLSELRSNNEIFGYKDGSNWKFKMSELERVAGELDINLNTSEAAKVADELSESMDFDLGDSSELMLDTEDPIIEDLDSGDYMEDSSVELTQQPGKPKKPFKEEVKLAESGLLKPGKGGSSKKGKDIRPTDENILDDDEELAFGSSSLSLASESSRKLASGSDVLDEAEGSSDSDTGKLLSGGKDDDFSLPEDDFTFADDSGSFEDSAELSSDFEDSGALILDDSDSSAEITLESNDSGINLSASVSGLSLDDSNPLDLGASDIDALELPGDDDEMIMLDDEASPDASTMMLQEDDFNLTPLEASLDDDDSSGSQVIALEDSEIYADESAPTLLGDQDDFTSQPQMIDDDSAFGDYSQAGMSPSMMTPDGMVGPAALPEAPYSIAQVVSLGAVALLLLTGGMVAYNLAQNLWMPSDQVVASGVLNFFLRLVGME